MCRYSSQVLLAMVVWMGKASNHFKELVEQSQCAQVDNKVSSLKDTIKKELEPELLDAGQSSFTKDFLGNT